MKNLRKGLVFSLVLLSVISLGSVAGTYAKYTSNATGTDNARVAKWSFTVGGTETATTNTFDFDLFKTAYTNNQSETTVKSKGSDNVIAPGTEGSFTIALANNSEVDATYEIDYTVTRTDNSIPVEFSVNAGQTWTADLADVAATRINMDNATANITVQWRWLFDGDDTTDTTLGTAGTDTITVSAKVTATQAD